MRVKIIICAILSIIAYCIFVQFSPDYHTKESKTTSLIKQLEIALTVYYDKYNSFPPNNNNCEIYKTLRESDCIAGEPSAYSDKKGNYLDGWGKPFVFNYDATNNTIKITSLGPNKKNDNGSKDDIVFLFKNDKKHN